MNELITLSMGLALAIGASCIGANQILLGPQAVNYPTAGFIPRFLMFGWCAALAYRSVDLLVGVSTGSAEKYPPSAIPATILLVLCQGALLYTTLRQWLPAKVWRRISQLIALATCGRIKALEARRKIDERAVDAGVRVDNPPAVTAQTAIVDLTLQGMRVIGPNEGPEAVFNSRA